MWETLAGYSGRVGAYRFVRPVLFRLDPERAHDLTVRAAELASRSRLLCRAVARLDSDPRLAVEVAGLRFRTPVGLAAGFDKSARAVPLLSVLGFGHVEIGSVSADPSAGNPRPRLARLPDERAIAVAYGVPNDGAERVAARLDGRRPPVPVGINVVSTNRGAASAVESDEAVIGDYVASVARLQDYGDYVCLNLSCPNTRDGRGFFADRSRLRALLDALAESGMRRPLFIKVAPFTDAREVDSLLEAVDAAPFVAGFSVNLPPGTRPDVPGAISGTAGARRRRAHGRGALRPHRPRAACGDRLGRHRDRRRRVPHDRPWRLARAGLHRTGLRGAGRRPAHNRGPRGVGRARRPA